MKRSCNRRCSIAMSLVAVALAMSIGYFFRDRSQLHSVDISPGTDIFSIDPALLRVLSYEGTHSLFRAVRANQKAREFEITVSYRDGRPTKMCFLRADSSQMVRIANGFCTLRANRGVGLDVVRKLSLIALGTVTIEDFSELEPTTFDFRSTPDRRSVYVLNEAQGFEVAVDVSLFDELAKGCE